MPLDKDEHDAILNYFSANMASYKENLKHLQSAADVSPEIYQQLQQEIDSAAIWEGIKQAG